MGYFEIFFCILSVIQISPKMELLLPYVWPYMHKTFHKDLLLITFGVFLNTKVKPLKIQ